MFDDDDFEAWREPERVPAEARLEVLDPPESADLTTVERLRAEVLRASAAVAEDDILRGYVAGASDLLRWGCRRWFTRQRVRETVVGDGSKRLRLWMTPISRLISVTGDFGVDDVSTLRVGEQFVYNDGGWGQGELTVEYWGGWLPPAADRASQAAGVAGGDYVLASTSAWPVGLVGSSMAGVVSADRVTVTGFSGAAAADNGIKTVEDVPDAQTLSVEQALVDDAAGTPRHFGLRTLPYEIERATLDVARGLYLSRDRDPALKSVTVGGRVSAEWQTWMPAATMWARRWARVDSPIWAMAASPRG